MYENDETALGVVADAPARPSLGALPLSLVPTFAVPLRTISHIISLLQLRTTARIAVAISIDAHVCCGTGRHYRLELRRLTGSRSQADPGHDRYRNSSLQGAWMRIGQLANRLW